MTKNNVILQVLRRKKLDYIKSKNFTRKISITPTPTGNPQIDLTVCILLTIAITVYTSFYFTVVFPGLEDPDSKEEQVILLTQSIQEYTLVGHNIHEMVTIMLPFLQANIPAEGMFLSASDILIPVVEYLDDFTRYYEQIDSMIGELIELYTSTEFMQPEFLADLIDARVLGSQTQIMLMSDIARIKALL